MLRCWTIVTMAVEVMGADSAHFRSTRTRDFAIWFGIDHWKQGGNWTIGIIKWRGSSTTPRFGSISYSAMPNI